MKQLCLKQNPNRGRAAQVFILTLIAVGLCVFSARETKADPLLFSNVAALQNSIRVDLFSNPSTVLYGPQVSFLVDITGTIPPNAPLQSLRITFAESGQAPIVQTFDIPAFGVIPPPFTQLFTVSAVGANQQGVSVLLTVDIIGSSPDFIIPGGPSMGQPVDSFTYSFKVAQPVPEPTTLILLATGVVGIGRRMRRRRNN